MAESQCMHEACSCPATQGEYCSDHCRENAGKGFETCSCGHTDCVGSHEHELEATG
jgi:hypothetical protein